MTPTVVDNPTAHRFEIRVDDTVAGFAAYNLAGSVASFTHTEVHPAYEGRGLGSVLARESLDAARDAGWSVLPFCPFIRRYVQRHPEYADLVPADRRAEFDLAER